MTSTDPPTAGLLVFVAEFRGWVSWLGPGWSGQVLRGVEVGSSGSPVSAGRPLRVGQLLGAGTPRLGRLPDHRGLQGEPLLRGVLALQQRPAGLLAAGATHPADPGGD